MHQIFVVMVPDSEVPFLVDVIEARLHDELVVEHAFEAVTDDDVEVSRSTPLGMMMTMTVTWKMLPGLEFLLPKFVFLKFLLLNMPVLMSLSLNMPLFLVLVILMTFL